MMQLLPKENTSISENYSENYPANGHANAAHNSNQQNQDPIKQKLRQHIYEILRTVSELASDDRKNEVRAKLLAIQNYCQTIGKTFIFVEQSITCDQFNLGGSADATATLFRGPSEAASVAICVTHRGSVLHRNGYAWTVYINEGDIPSAMICNPLEFITLLS